MMRTRQLLALALCCAAVSVGTCRADDASATAALKKLGAQIYTDDKTPTVQVELAYSKLTDTDLKLLTELKKPLVVLNLGYTGITDEARETLKELKGAANPLSRQNENHGRGPGGPQEIAEPVEAVAVRHGRLRTWA